MAKTDDDDILKHSSALTSRILELLELETLRPAALDLLSAMAMDVASEY